MLPYRRAGGFWERDGGLLVQERRRQGRKASLVLLPGESPEDGVPLITGSLDEMADPHWWRARNPSLVVLYAWGMPRYAPVAKAIRKAGIRLQVQFDSDGVISPRVNAWRYYYTIYWGYKEHGFRERYKAFPWLTAGLNLFWHWLNPLAYDRPMVTHLEQADWVALESPLAASHVKKFLCRMGRADLAGRVIVSPHPVDHRFQYDGGGKEREIMAIGRWHSMQKDAALLMATLKLTLVRHPGWKATVIGAGDEGLNREVAVWPEALRKRIAILGRQPHDCLPDRLRRSRILLVTSRYESFHIAAAEALCCGNSVVGPASIPSFCWFTSSDSGSVATRRNSVALDQAVSEEIGAWESGRRRPEVIARQWVQNCGVESCMRAIEERGQLDEFGGQVG